MTKPLRLDEEAEKELAFADSWYEARRPGLGGDFVAAVRTASQRIARRPKQYRLVPGVSRSLSVRRCLLRRFPYALVFVELEHEIRVLAVAHLHRRPGYWRGRLKP
jgi:plasmid stabilization system protein ParE